MLYDQRYAVLRQVLQDLRHHAHLTQEELAKKLGRGQSYVSKIERGERYLDVLEFILWCEACNAVPESAISKI